VVRACARDTAALAGERCARIEYGSGAGVKVRRLLDAFALESHPIAAYVPIDLSREQLAEVSSRIAAEYATIPVHPVCAGYTTPLRLPDLPQRARRVAVCRGSAIGDFHPIEAPALLRHVFFNETASRVEMHLVSLEAQVVHVAGERIAFEAGESIWTESPTSTTARHLIRS
jgi:uncharacterized SAM-dependent methyltransferase